MLGIARPPPALLEEVIALLGLFEERVEGLLDRLELAREALEVFLFLFCVASSVESVWICAAALSPCSERVVSWGSRAL